jgi:hypothetical protein
VSVGANDLFIAARAGALAVTLVTNNTAEFERVPVFVEGHICRSGLSWRISFHGRGDVAR